MKTNEIENYLDIGNRVDALLDRRNGHISPRDIDGKFHPSALGGCARKLWYAFTMTEPQHRIAPKLRRTFDHGHAVHDWQQRELREVLNVDDVDCTLSFDTEVSITDTPFAHEWNIAGSADGLICVRSKRTGEEARVIYELKTMAKSSWLTLSKPLEKHIMQASVYAEALGASHIVFQYYCKDADVSKYFYVEKRAEDVMDVCDTLQLVLNTLSDGTSPARVSSRWECQSCQYYYTCQPELN
jgi:CRISPR/Cas system-associated exonuclease Cas4 (RecB family)